MKPIRELVGRQVKLKRSAKRAIGRQHWNEFHRQRGVILVPYVFMGEWPEVNVLWYSGLRYLYRREHLDILP